MTKLFEKRFSERLTTITAEAVYRPRLMAENNL